MIIRLPIDIKSLYFNIKNDNKAGHTATVATPVKQGKSIHRELAQIFDLPENINIYSRENLITKIVSKSRAEAKITNVFLFDKLTVNGKKVECDASFCTYVREETGVENVHFGRQKLHYPPTLNYEDEDVYIDNRKVMDAISDMLSDYAFIIEAFEYNTETKVLNFDAVIIGENDIPYSKVFQNKKGVGNKFSSVFNEFADVYDAEIIALREHLGYENVFPENFIEVVESNRDISIKNVINALENDGKEKIRVLSEAYPYSLYDIEYSEDGVKKYIIVRFTATKICYFNLTHHKIKFCNDFFEDTKIVLLTDINGSPSMEWYTISDLNAMNKAINSITYTNRG